MIVTADTGYANEENMKYLFENDINAYIPDNQFRSRDPKFSEQKIKYVKRNQDTKKTKCTYISANEFSLNVEEKTCICPANEDMWLQREGVDIFGNEKIFFEGRISKCRTCELKNKCMRNPVSEDATKGKGRQVSFITQRNEDHKKYTNWMKERIDSEKDKEIYSHRMSVVEPVFANIESNKRLNRFSLRGKEKVQGQWQLFCIVHNIEKIMNYG